MKATGKMKQGTRHTGRARAGVANWIANSEEGVRRAVMTNLLKNYLA